MPGLVLGMGTQWWWTWPSSQMQGTDHRDVQPADKQREENGIICNRQKDISQLYKCPCNQGETLDPINRHSVKTQFTEEGIKLANTWRGLFLVRLHHKVRSWCHLNTAGMWEGGPSWRWWGLRCVPHTQGRGGCMVTSRPTSGTPPSHIMMWTYRATWETVWKMKLASYPPTGSVQVNLRASVWGNMHTEQPRRMSWRLRYQMKMSVIFEVGKSKCL